MESILFTISLIFVAGLPAGEFDEPAKPKPGAAGPQPLGVLAPHELDDLLLSKKEQKRYDAALAEVRKHAQPARGEPDPAGTALRLFREAAVHLQFGQEAKALQADQDGWNALLDKWQKDTKHFATDLAGMPVHFQPFAVLLEHDRPLLLTFLHELDELYVEAFARTKKRAPERFAPIGYLWVKLAGAEKLGDEDLEKASFWVTLAGADAFTDRRLPDAEKARYQVELAGSGVGYRTMRDPARLRAMGYNPGQVQEYEKQFRDRQELFTGGGGQPLAQSRDLQDALVRWESVERADIRITEAAVHLKYGQDRQAVLAFADGVSRLSQSGDRFPNEAKLVRERGFALAESVNPRNSLAGPLLQQIIGPRPQPQTRMPCGKQKKSVKSLGQ